LAGPLAGALISTMAFEAVERLNRELEARVTARTAELAQKNDELALLNQRKDELVASVSHDFRSPLAIIRQNVQTILRDLPSMASEDLLMFVQGIARQADRLTAMCTNLLDLARLKQRNAPKEPVDLGILARTMTDAFASRARAKNVDLALDVEAEGDVVVAGDGARLGQVLQNLVDNALKFTSDGGRVALSVSSGDTDSVRVVVEDSGIGVPDEALGRVFEPFFQVPNQRYVGQGSGLGLAIVKAVVDAHGGAIVVESVVGHGARFIVTLPRRHGVAQVSSERS
jgi:signal transduction histidine kinase